MNTLLDEKDAIIAKIEEEARSGWKGPIGEARAAQLSQFIKKMLNNYSKILGIDENEIMSCLENKRDYSAINFYQELNLPSLENVTVFETSDDFIKKFPTKKYQCPSCNGVSTDKTDCNANPEPGEGRCNWKAYGLFGTLGKGLRFVVKDSFLKNPVVYEIFMPIED